MVEYAYDSWGKLLSCTGTLATTLGALNPFRYRGYVYDEETQWYYLKSRYYDPETCRFISADVYLSTGQGVIGHNCYAYCLNNPDSYRDSNGTSVIGTVLGVAAALLVAGMIGGVFSMASGGSFKAGFASGVVTAGFVIVAGIVGTSTGLAGIALIGTTSAGGAVGGLFGYLVESKIDDRETSIQSALIRTGAGLLSGAVSGDFSNLFVKYGSGIWGDCAEAITQYYVAVESEGFVGLMAYVFETFLNELGINIGSVQSDTYFEPEFLNLLSTE